MWMSSGNMTALERTEPKDPHIHSCKICRTFDCRNCSMKFNQNCLDFF